MVKEIRTDRQTFSFSSFPIPIKSNLTFQLIFQDSIKLTWCISIWWIVSIQVDVIKSSVVGRCLKMMKRNGRNRLPKCLIAGIFDCSLIVLAIDTEFWDLQSTCSIYWHITSIIYRYMEQLHRRLQSFENDEKLKSGADVAFSLASKSDFKLKLRWLNLTKDDWDIKVERLPFKNAMLQFPSRQELVECDIKNRKNGHGSR